MPALKSVPPYYLRWSKKTGLCPSSTSNTVLGIQLRKKYVCNFLLHKTCKSQKWRLFYLSHLEYYTTTFLQTKFAGAHKECRISVKPWIPIADFFHCFLAKAIQLCAIWDRYFKRLRELLFFRHCYRDKTEGTTPHVRLFPNEMYGAGTLTWVLVPIL